MVDAAQARKVIQGNNWIDGKTSRHVLRSIIFGKSPVDAYTQDPRVNEMVKVLKAEYWRIRKNCEEDAPRNLPFLKLVAERYPGFSWRETAGSIHWPVRVGGVAPSLLTLLMGLIAESEFDPGSTEAADPLAIRLRGILDAAEIVPPEADAFADVLQ